MRLVQVLQRRSLAAPDVEMSFSMDQSKFSRSGLAHRRQERKLVLQVFCGS